MSHRLANAAAPSLLNLRRLLRNHNLALALFPVYRTEARKMLILSQSGWPRKVVVKADRSNSQLVQQGGILRKGVPFWFNLRRAKKQDENDNLT
jgi:hypothetical protein